MTPGQERILKRLCRSAILRQHLDILHVSQNPVNAFASPREMSNPTTCSMKLEIRSRWNRKFHGIRSCECYGRLPTRIHRMRTSRTKFVSVGYILEASSKPQLTRGAELLTSTGSNQSHNVSKKMFTSGVSVKTFSRRWIPLPFSSSKAVLYPKRSRTAHTLAA